MIGFFFTRHFKVHVNWYCSCLLACLFVFLLYGHGSYAASIWLASLWKWHAPNQAPWFPIPGQRWPHSAHNPGGNLTWQTALGWHSGLIAGGTPERGRYERARRHTCGRLRHIDNYRGVCTGAQLLSACDRFIRSNEMRWCGMSALSSLSASDRNKWQAAVADWSPAAMSPTYHDIYNAWLHLRERHECQLHATLLARAPGATGVITREHETPAVLNRTEL